MENPTLVVLTDRNDLDDQLFGQFQRCHEILRQTPVQAGAGEQLRELLQCRERRRGLHDDPEVHAGRERREERRCYRSGGTSSSSPTKRTAASTT